MSVFSLESLKPFCSLLTPGMPNKTIYWTPVLYLRDLLGNWLVAELGGVCDQPLRANGASESQQSCLDSPVAEVKIHLLGSCCLVVLFCDQVLDQEEWMPAFLLSFFHFSFQKVGLQVDGNQIFVNSLVTVQWYSFFSEDQSWGQCFPSGFLKHLFCYLAC